MVHQHFTSIDHLTARENLALAVGRLDQNFEWGSGLLEGLAPATRVQDLSVSVRQRFEVAKALAAGASVLLLDEPSAAMAPSEIDGLLRLVRGFAQRGGAVALITHKLPEVFAVADRVTVLRKGRVTLQRLVGEQTQAELAAAMIGESGPGATDLEHERAGAGPRRTVAWLGSVSIQAGDLIGIAAVEGQGHRALLDRLAQAPGTAFVPEDRTTEGLIPEMTLTENLVLGRDRDPRWRKGFWLRWEAAKAHAGAVIQEYQVTAQGPDSMAGGLSGGNQQRVMVARALESRPDVLVVENPFRGLDLRATSEIRERLRNAARRGIAVLVYSTDLDEVLGLGERILVVRNHAVREAPRGADRQAVGRLMLGLDKEST